jgi:protein-S-isoprenylcysteine O-methyltransferase Ste14
MNPLKHIAAILALPGMVVVLIPAVILSSSRERQLGGTLAMPLNAIAVILGGGLVIVGLWLMVLTVSLFIRVGKGTLAPWMPTQRLVVRGIYRNVRNPMITGVFCILLGEAGLFGLWGLFYWFLIVVLVNAIYIPMIEEPGLEERFGDDYRRYKQNVPRWIPRLKAWEDGLGQG